MIHCQKVHQQRTLIPLIVNLNKISICQLNIVKYYSKYATTCDQIKYGMKIEEFILYFVTQTTIMPEATHINSSQGQCDQSNSVHWQNFKLLTNHRAKKNRSVQITQNQ